jgi:calcineurin-like phosphoesterase family protein
MNRRTIVTLNSLPEVRSGGLERRAAGPQDRVLEARHDEIVRRLSEETERVGSSDVLIAVPDRDVSLMQSELARQAEARREGLPSHALEAKFGTGRTGGDWWGWLKSTFNWVDQGAYHDIVRPSNAIPLDLNDRFRIAMFGDWGTDMYGAPEIVAQIRKQGPFDLLLHLGDVYYAGTVDEVQERLIDPWPKDVARWSRTLNGNHEMYSGGYGYFDGALKALDQPSSYFAFQNQHWLLVGLDTAYVDHDMDVKQVGWLNTLVSAAGRRKVVLFSHQQLFSRLDQQGPKLHKALLHLLNSRIITAWYWGHEHQCVLYDRHPAYGLTARCLGNGGIPEPRKKQVKSAVTESSVGGLTWKRLAATEESPSCLVLDGPNRFVEGEEEKFGPHGFMTLEFNGPTLHERVYHADGVLLEHQIE